MSETTSLITLRSILDIEIARTYQWDAATIITVSGVDRAGDLTTRIVEYPGALADIAAEGFSPHSAAGHALSHELTTRSNAACACGSPTSPPPSCRAYATP